MAIHKLPVIVAVTLAAMPVLSAAAQNYAVIWTTFGGGSDTTAGGPYQLVGAIEQTQTDRLAGGPWRLVGGFVNPVSAAPCPADIDGDRQVQLSDLANLLINFGLASGANHAQGDIDGNGAVNLTDLAYLLTQFGLVCPI